MIRGFRRALAGSAALALAAASFVLVASPAAAAGCTVTLPGDAVTDGTLRYAVETANCAAIAIDAGLTITLDDVIILEQGTSITGGFGTTITRDATEGDFNLFSIEPDPGIANQVYSFSNLAFQAGASGYGRAIQAGSINPFTSFTTNNTSFQGFQTDGIGAAIFIGNPGAANGPVVLSVTSFSNGHADNSGGAVAISFVSSVTVAGNGSGVGSAQGNDATSGGAFTFGAIDGPVTIRDYVFTDNDATDGQGGAIDLNNIGGDVTIEGTIFGADTEGNTATAEGGAASIENVDGDLSFFGCEFRNNDAVTHGGGLHSLLVGGQIVLDSTLFYGNGADDGFGGGAAVNPDIEVPLPGNVSIQNGTRFELNNAEIRGGGAFINGVNTVTVTDTTFDDNISDSTAGGLYVSGLTASLTIARTEFTENGADHGGALRFEEIPLVNIDLTLFQNNATNDSGGAIGNGMTLGQGIVTITNSDFITNHANNGYGGAIFTDGSIDGAYTIARTNFIGNTAVEGEGSANGGAIYVDSVDEPFTIDSSTFAGNATDGDGTSVYVADIDDGETALFFIVNSTFDEDQSGASGETMIFVEENSGTFSIKYSTLVGFEPVHVGNSPGTETVASTIVQSAPGQEDLNGEDDPFRTEYSILSKPLDTLDVTDLGHNQFATNALLGALQNNGGRTDTRLPASNSPALSNGGPSLGAPSLDQRFTGFPRIVGTLDVGAVEIPAALAATGSTGLPIWVPIVGGIVLLAGIGFVVFSVINRRKGAGGGAAANDGASAADAGPGTGGDALFPEASSTPPTAEPPAEFGPGQDPKA